MSLQLKISVEECVNSFIVNDCTGAYSYDNKGGYGPLNKEISAITEAYLEFWGPSDTEYSNKLNVLGELPNKDGFGVEILPYMVGNQDGIESGKWKIKYTEVYASGTYATTETVVFTKNIECCIDKLTANGLNGDVFKDEKQKLIIELSNLLESVIKQKECGLYDTANKNIDYLKSHCKCCGCN